MKVIGITGGIGTGKSTVTERIAYKGFVTIDADEISRNITAGRTDAVIEIEKKIGREVIKEDGTLDRKKTADIVFTDKRKKEILESIVTEKVIEEIGQKIEALKKQGEKAVFLDVPLLFETGTDRICDMIWLVTADKEERIGRVMRRDKVTRQAVLNRMKNQMPEEEKRKKSDLIIDNSCGKEELYLQIDTGLEKIC